MDAKLLMLLTILMVSNLLLDHTNLSWKGLNTISRKRIYALFGVLLIIVIDVEIKHLYSKLTKVSQELLRISIFLKKEVAVPFAQSASFPNATERKKGKNANHLLLIPSVFVISYNPSEFTTESINEMKEPKRRITNIIVTITFISADFIPASVRENIFSEPDVAIFSPSLSEIFKR